MIGHFIIAMKISILEILSNDLHYFDRLDIYSQIIICFRVRMLQFHIWKLRAVFWVRVNLSMGWWFERQ